MLLEHRVSTRSRVIALMSLLSHQNLRGFGLEKNRKNIEETNHACSCSQGHVTLMEIMSKKSERAR